MLQLMGETMNRLAKNWWVFILQGILAILFGILVVAWPSVSIFVLVILFGAYALASGIVSIIFAATHKGNWWGSRAWLIVWGIIGIGAGVVTFFWPGITAIVLLIIIAVWALLSGIAELVFAFTIPATVGNRVLLALGGIFSIIFGIFLMARPVAGALAVIWIISIFALMFGIYYIVFGISLRDLKNKIKAK